MLASTDYARLRLDCFCQTHAPCIVWRLPLSIRLFAPFPDPHRAYFSLAVSRAPIFASFTPFVTRVEPTLLRAFSQFISSICCLVSLITLVRHFFLWHLSRFLLNTCQSTFRTRFCVCAIDLRSLQDNSAYFFNSHNFLWSNTRFRVRNRPKPHLSHPFGFLQGPRRTSASFHRTYSTRLPSPKGMTICLRATFKSSCSH